MSVMQAGKAERRLGVPWDSMVRDLRRQIYAVVEARRFAQRSLHHLLATNTGRNVREGFLSPRIRCNELFQNIEFATGACLPLLYVNVSQYLYNLMLAYQK